MDNLGITCEVCEEFFSSELPPRNLRCGHSVCGACANRILSGDKKCPECRKDVKATTITEMPINQPLLKIALSFSQGSKGAGSSGSPKRMPPPGPVPSAPPEELLPSAPPEDLLIEGTGSSGSLVDAGECELHKRRLTMRCLPCKCWICDECVLSSHKKPPSGQCRTLPLVPALQELKSTYLNASYSKVQFAEKLKRRIMKEVATLDELREKKRKILSDLGRLLQESEIIVATGEAEKEERSRKSNLLQDLRDQLKATRDIINHAETLEDAEISILTAEAILTQLEQQLTLDQHRRPARLPVVKSLTKQNLRNLVDVVEKGIFVSHFSESHQQRWARITEKDGLLHLHALHSTDDQPSGLIFPYSLVRNMVPLGSPSIFMDISISGKYRGRVYIRMFGNTIRSTQAIYLCSGEKGPSYKGTCFYKAENVDTQMEILRGGDYTNNNGTGGRAILNGITSGSVYKSQIIAGLMVGWPVDDHWRLGSFDFYLGNCEGRYDMSAYGIVSHGLEILKLCARQKKVRDTCVKDCGLVIPI